MGVLVHVLSTGVAGHNLIYDPMGAVPPSVWSSSPIPGLFSGFAQVVHIKFVSLSGVPKILFLSFYVDT